MNTHTVEHEEYAHYKEIWEINNAFCKDEKAVKALKQKALPIPFTGSDLAQQEKDYETFKDAAPFLGFAAKTLQTMIGLINRIPAVTELATQLEYLNKNANGNGLGIKQHIARTVNEVCKNARYGVLVELPSQGGQTMADNMRGSMPKLIGYTALEIPYWNDEGTLIILKERVESTKNITEDSLMYGNTLIDQWRVLYLEEGKYKQRVYNQELANSYEEIDVLVNGRSLDFIPFQFFGAENNDSTVDESQLTAIVTANKNHFFNSALDQNITRMCSLIGLFISTEMGVDQIKEAFPNGMSYGATQGYFLGVNDSVNLVQANESNAAARKADKILEDAKQLGAKMIDPQGDMTATEANINATSDGSYLGIIAVNVEDGYNNLLDMISRIIGLSSVSKVSVNKQFVTSKMTAQERAAWISDVVAGNVTREEYRSKLKEAGEVSEIDNPDLAPVEQDNPANDPDLINNGV